MDAINRRTFLTSIGAGAAGGIALRPVEFMAQELADLPTGRRDRFSRIFELPPFAEATSAVQRALLEIGEPGGLLDAKDPLHEGPVRLITNSELSLNNPDITSSTAGMTFLGQ